MYFQHFLEDGASIGMSFCGFCTAKMWCFFFSRSILQHQTSHYIPNLCASHFILIHCAERQAVLKWQLSAARERLGSTENRSKSSHTSPTHISPPSCCPCSRNQSGTILRFGLAQHFHYRNGFSIAPLGLERACSVPDLLKKETELRNCEEKGLQPLPQQKVWSCSWTERGSTNPNYVLAQIHYYLDKFVHFSSAFLLSPPEPYSCSPILHCTSCLAAARVLQLMLASIL